jgi:hypothetical protein
VTQTGFIWLRIATTGELLWRRYRNWGFQTCWQVRGQMYLKRQKGDILLAENTTENKLALTVDMHILQTVAKNLQTWRMASSGMLRCAALLKTDVSEEHSASFIRLTRIYELGRTLAVTSNDARLYLYLFAACVSCYLRLTFLVHQLLSPWWWRRWVPPKRRFLKEPRGITSQKTAL